MERYITLADGKTDLREQIIPTLRYYDMWRKSMQNDLRVFSAGAASLAWYIRKIRED